MQLTLIDHAPWCPRRHPETEDGLTWLVDPDQWLTGHYPYLDRTAGAALLKTLTRAAEDAGAPLLHVVTGDGVKMRLCALWRLRELEGAVCGALRGMLWTEDSERLALRLN